MSNISRKNKSRNNRRKTQGRFTDNPIQYLQFQNREKYMHRIDEDFINRNTQDVKVIFDYGEVCRYLEVNNLDSEILNMCNQ